MWKCKQVADALSEKHYAALPWYSRLGLRLHVGLCLVCGRYHRNVLAMQDIADSFHARETTGELPAAGLTDEARTRIAAAIKSRHAN